LASGGAILEYDGARPGGFQPLRFVPKGKKVGLGPVSTLDPKDDLKHRIEEAAR